MGFAEKVRNLIERAYTVGKGYTDQQRSDLALDVFRRGLRADIKEKFIFIEPPDNFEEGIKKAIEIEDIIQTNKKDTTIENKLEDMEKNMEIIKQSINSMSLSNQEQTIAWMERGQRFQRGYIRKSSRKPSIPKPWKGRIPCFSTTTTQRQYNPDGEYENRGRGRGNNFRSRGKRRYQIIPTAPFLTIVFMAMMATIGGQFQICNIEDAKTNIKLPEEIKCEINTNTSRMSKIELYIPKAIPKIFEAYRCYKEVEIVCTYSFMFFAHQITGRNIWREAIKSEECTYMIENYETITKEALTPTNYEERRTENAAKIQYSFVGTMCLPTENWVIQQGETGILRGRMITTWIDDIDLQLGSMILITWIDDIDRILHGTE